MNLQDIAKEVLEVLGTGRQLDPFSKVYPDFGVRDAYNVTAAVRAEKEARGERPIGRKIGFTNRTIWAEYGVLRANLGLCLRWHGPRPRHRSAGGFVEGSGRTPYRARDHV